MRFNFSGYSAFFELIAKNGNVQKIGKGVVLRAQKLTRPPFRPKKNILKYRVYGIQKKRLCNTIPMKQSIN
jgi:hypothetical protein